MNWLIYFLNWVLIGSVFYLGLTVRKLVKLHRQVLAAVQNVIDVWEN